MKTIATTLFGFSVILSGIYRIVSAEGGSTGLTFGLIMGAIALVGAGLIWKQKRIPGFSLAWISVAFVGGWFFYEALIKKGFSNSEPRQLIVIALSAITAIILLLPASSSHSSKSDDSTISK